MGAGGNLYTPTTKTRQKENCLQRAPTSKPPFTLADIKKVIPPHCFQRSLIRSYYYLVRDLIFASLFYYVATTYFHVLPSSYSYLAWPIYWIFQGCVFTALWVVAHECGHHSFSEYPWIDNITGLILHSALLVPYFSWKYSHRRHHSNVASLENDENFVPKPKSELKWYTPYANNPVGRLLIVAFTLTLGLPTYFATNIGGKPYDRWASHYDPYSPIYNDRERVQIFIADVGVVGAIYMLYRIAMVQGLAWVICIYGVPVTFASGFIVLITFLHHTHPSLPHYDSSEWNWLKGALATIDRDYGVLNTIFHHITDTHVLHHLFSTIPHYHAVEATNAIKPLLGEYYRYDRTPYYNVMWMVSKECIYVEEEEDEKKGVFWYKNKL